MKFFVITVFSICMLTLLSLPSACCQDPEIDPAIRTYVNRQIEMKINEIDYQSEFDKIKNQVLDFDTVWDTVFDIR